MAGDGGGDRGSSGATTAPPAPTAPVPARPPDFDDFWSATLDGLGDVPLDLRRTAAPAPVRGTRAHAVSFLSWRHRRIHGYAVTWDDAAPRPLIVHAHGYRSQVTPRVEWIRAGCHVLGFDIRGFGTSAAAVPDPSPAGWLLTGVRRPETSVLRGAVCDYVRAMQAGAALGVRAARTVCHGVSLAGGLATMAEALAPRADLLVLGVPTFGWTEGRRLLVERGSGAEISAFLGRNPEYPEDDVHDVLAYFDAASFAAEIGCPTLVGIGRVDRVVPYACVAAITDRLRAPHEVMEFPVSHDAGPAMRAWDAFDERWLALALDGVPTGFGGDHRGRMAASSRQDSAAAVATQRR